MSAITWRQATKDDVGRLARFADRIGDDWMYGLYSGLDAAEGFYHCVDIDGYSPEWFFICEVQDVAAVAAKTPEPPCDVLQLECRQEFIDRHVDRAVDDLFNESLYWNMPGGGTHPLFVEIRDAIMAKLFAEQHEFGRQELHAEQVRDNCI